MIENIAKVAHLIALLLSLPAFITAIMILKEYQIHNIRFAKYFKFFMLQGFIHSILLVLALFFVDFKTAFLIHSFVMIPLYALLAFRLYHLKYLRQARLEAKKTIRPQRTKPRAVKIDPAKLKGIRLARQKKSRWH